MQTTRGSSNSLFVECAVHANIIYHTKTEMKKSLCQNLISRKDELGRGPIEERFKGVDRIYSAPNTEFPAHVKKIPGLQSGHTLCMIVIDCGLRLPSRRLAMSIDIGYEWTTQKPHRFRLQL